MFANLTMLLLVACNGTEAPGPANASAPPKTAPVSSGAPVGSADVGPDGPASLTVPTFEVTTDAGVLAQGKAAFDTRGCGACHQFGSKLVGPDLNGVGERRTPTWIARMVRHPAAMVKQDPAAKQMFRELMVEMPDQGVLDEEVGPLVSFLVSHPAAGGASAQ